MLTTLVLAALIGCSPQQDTDLRSEQGFNPFAREKFYVHNPDAEKQAAKWRDSRPADAAQMDKIAAQPGTWYFGEWTEEAPGGTIGQVDYRVSEIAERGALPVLGVYAIPNRDCGAYSSGGFATGEEYKRWISDFAVGIGERKAVVIVEPDALGVMGCLTDEQKQERLTLIEFAVETFKANPQTYVYIASHGYPYPVEHLMADRLWAAGVGEADGFALNVSGFDWTDHVVTFGKRLSPLVGDKHFIVDTSRNGLGPAEPRDWCNPPGRALGPRPTADTEEPLVDAYYWLKWPGESDGECRGFPRAGTWVPEYALGLAERAAY